MAALPVTLKKSIFNSNQYYIVAFTQMHLKNLLLTGTSGKAKAKIDNPEYLWRPLTGDLGRFYLENTPGRKEVLEMHVTFLDLRLEKFKGGRHAC